jgi:beta-galactosidase
MLYMVRPGVAERIASFVQAGRTFVATYWSGIVDENDLVFLGGFPGPLREVLGIWAEEIDALYEGDANAVLPTTGNELGLEGPYVARELCDLIHAEDTEVLATYGADFYAGRPALTVNHFGQGQAFYIASRNDERFLDDFCGALDARLGLLHTLPADLPAGVSAQLRSDGEYRYRFVMNFRSEPMPVDLGAGSYLDLLSGGKVSGEVTLDPYGVMVLSD